MDSFMAFMSPLCQPRTYWEKSPEYVKAYSEEYRRVAKEEGKKTAAIGCVIWGGGAVCTSVRVFLT